MAVFETWLKTDLTKPINVEVIRGVVFSQDNMANKVGVKVTYNGEAAELNGTIVGSVIRDDGATVSFGGELENGSEAYVILPQAAYAVVGRISVLIRLIDGDQIMTLGACTGYVYRSGTDQAVDAGGVTPDLATLLSKIDAADRAARAANAAATRASTAAYRIENLKTDIYTEEIVDEHYRVIVENSNGSHGINQKRKIILIGDSYGTGFVVGQAWIDKPWTEYVKETLETTNYDIAVYICSRTSTSFGEQNHNALKFENIFDAGSAVVGGTSYDYPAFTLPEGVDNNEITDIILLSGRNDFGRTSDYGVAVVRGIEAFIAECKTRFPKAQISIGMVGGISLNGHDMSTGSDLYVEDNEARRLSVSDYYSQCGLYGAKFIANCDSILRDTEYMSADGAHPNQSGQQQIAQYIIGVILGGSINVIRQRSYSGNLESGWNVQDDLPNAWNGIFYIDEVQTNQRVTISTRGPLMLYRASALTIQRGDRIKLFSPDNSCFSGDAYIHGGVSATVIAIDSGSQKHHIRVSFIFRDGYVQMQYEGLDDQTMLDSSAQQLSISVLCLPKIVINV